VSETSEHKREKTVRKFHMPLFECLSSLFSPVAVSSPFGGINDSASESGGVQVTVGLLPPTFPRQNAPWNDDMDNACQNVPTNVPKCDQLMVQAINAARAAEGVPPLQLPANYAQKSGANKLLTLIHLERTDRGLPGVNGAVLNPTLNALAQTGASQQTDPSPPPQSAFPNGSSSCHALGDGTSLAAVYGWLYIDGYDPNPNAHGGTVVNCNDTDKSGCWSHRNAILTDFNGVSPSMGAAVVPSQIKALDGTNIVRNSYATLLAA